MKDGRKVAMQLFQKERRFSLMKEPQEGGQSEEEVGRPTRSKTYIDQPLRLSTGEHFDDGAWRLCEDLW